MQHFDLILFENYLFSLFRVKHLKKKWKTFKNIKFKFQYAVIFNCISLYNLYLRLKRSQDARNKKIKFFQRKKKWKSDTHPFKELNENGGVETGDHKTLKTIIILFKNICVDRVGILKSKFRRTKKNIFLIFFGQ